MMPTPRLENRIYRKLFNGIWFYGLEIVQGDDTQYARAAIGTAFHRFPHRNYELKFDDGRECLLSVIDGDFAQEPMNPQNWRWYPEDDIMQAVVCQMFTLSSTTQLILGALFMQLHSFNYITMQISNTFGNTHRVNLLDSKYKHDPATQLGLKLRKHPRSDGDDEDRRDVKHFAGGAGGGKFSW